MDQADHQNRPGSACGPTCDQKGMSAIAQQPAPAHWPSEMKRGQRLLAIAMTTAALLVGLNALVQALNVLAAWWSHAR